MGWRYMDSFPVHTFRWVNAKNEGVYVRYKIVADAGIKNFTWCGTDSTHKSTRLSPSSYL